MSLINLYKNLPPRIKDTLKYSYSLIPLKMRLGKRFFKQLEFLEESQWWSEQELENYQNEQLRKLIKHAYENVPYYNRLFKTNKLTLNDIRTVEDLPKIPILTKAIIRNNLRDFRAMNFKDNEVVKLNTSGTTGRPLIFYYDKVKDYLNHDPFIWRYFGWADHKIDELRATLSSWTTNEDIIYNPVRDLLILSAYKLNLNNVEKYANIMQCKGVRYLDGYPSMIELFTSFMKEKKIRCPVSLRAIFVHSEYLYDWQRAIIENFWGCKCFDWYALEERVVLGLECERHEGLHLCSDFGIAEFIDDNGGFKQIIATSLTNYAMPFIRYDTEDVGELNEKKCSCGRGFPLFILKGGRHKSFAIKKDGSYISLTNIDIPDVTDNVRQFQFIQEKKGSMFLRIIRKDGFGEADINKIRHKLNEKFADSIDITLQFVDVIQQTENKKAPIFIQNIKEDSKSGTIS
jgi:phenylacetate-CoA ligase